MSLISVIWAATTIILKVKKKIHHDTYFGSSSPLNT